MIENSSSCSITNVLNYSTLLTEKHHGNLPFLMDSLRVLVRKKRIVIFCLSSGKKKSSPQVKLGSIQTMWSQCKASPQMFVLSKWFIPRIQAQQHSGIMHSIPCPLIAPSGLISPSPASCLPLHRAPQGDCHGDCNPSNTEEQLRSSIPQSKCSKVRPAATLIES